MLASEARKLSETKNEQKYSDWFQSAIKQIEKSALDKNNEKNITYIYLGKGSYHNKQFANELNEKEKLIHRMGYKTSLHTETSWGSIFYSTYDYYLKVKW